MRFHISAAGAVVPCSAEEGNCPLKGEHFDYIHEGYAHLEKVHKEAAMSSIVRKSKDRIAAINQVLLEVGDKVTLTNENFGIANSPQEFAYDFEVTEQNKIAISLRDEDNRPLGSVIVERTEDYKPAMSKLAGN